MEPFRIEDNRLHISEDVRDQFIVVHDKFGEGIAYSSDTLIVFDDERGTKTHAITPDTFKWLGSRFFILNKFIFHGAYKLGRINAAAIRGQTEFYVWDDKTVYYLNGKVAEANPAAFQDLGNYWSRDDQHCFFQRQLVPGVDLATFRVIDDTFAVDARYIYGFAGIVVADYYGDPIPLGRTYYSINGRIYSGNKLMSDADFETFTVLPQYDEQTKSQILAAGGARNAEEALALAGFTAYDSRYQYKFDWHKK